MSSTVPEQADVDPIVVVLEWLRAHERVAALFPGATLEHVTGIPEAPWPHLVVDDGPGGDLRDLRWEAEYEINLEVYGHPNGAPGKAALRHIAVKVLQVLANLPEEQPPSPGVPVVSRVRPSGREVYQPLGNGQPVYRFGALVTIRPPRTHPEAPPAPEPGL